jgi:dTDP-4-dehydrorhamnose 3,5-epimerase
MKELTTETPIEGIKLFEHRKFGDERGLFWELFKKSENTLKYSFCQDNIATSQKNVLRGLHFQKPPYDQGKLVHVIQGSVLDVVVDIRKGSDTYGQWASFELTSDNGLALWVPPGFAHGYATFEDNTIFHYKCTNEYNPESEGGIMFNDSSLNIDWGLTSPIISSKDERNSTFVDFKTPF